MSINLKLRASNDRLCCDAVADLLKSLETRGGLLLVPDDDTLLAVLDGLGNSTGTAGTPNAAQLAGMRQVCLTIGLACAVRQCPVASSCRTEPLTGCRWCP